MRVIALFATIGAILGGAVGIVAHYQSHELQDIGAPPHGRFLVGKEAFGLARVVHSAWWPTMLFCVLGGLLVGVLAALVIRGLGYRLQATRVG